VAVNDLTDNKTLAHLLKYDSVLGDACGTTWLDGDGVITVDGTRSRSSRSGIPRTCPWGELGVDIVIESTGRFTKAGARASTSPAARRRSSSPPRPPGGRHRSSWA
jgi:glyceraldehyde 3-phosphate dehydrogenase